MAWAALGASVYHILAMAAEEGRDEECRSFRFSQAQSCVPRALPLRGVMQLRESKTVGDMRVSPMLMTVEMSNPQLVREMLDAGADP
jgi:hypothetical protein